MLYIYMFLCVDCLLVCYRLFVVCLFFVRFVRCVYVVYWFIICFWFHCCVSFDVSGFVCVCIVDCLRLCVVCLLVCFVCCGSFVPFVT